MWEWEWIEIESQSEDDTSDLEEIAQVDEENPYLHTDGWQNRWQLIAGTDTDSNL